MPKPANNDLDNEHYYSYEDSAGSGVRVYVVDEGINLESSVSTPAFHHSLQTNVLAGMDRERQTRARLDLRRTVGHWSKG